MDKERHLIQDNAFEVYERASYGHGCEIQQITDDKHKKCKLAIVANFTMQIIIIGPFFLNYSLLSWLWIAGQIIGISCQKGCISTIRIGMQK